MTIRNDAIDRRRLVQAAMALAVIGATPATLAAQHATPAPVMDAGVAGQTRGAGGEVKILQWQAPTSLSLHTASGTKDHLAASIVSEPLMSYLPDGSLLPRLVREVPSVENGLLAPTYDEVTYRLLPDVVWSDGEPFTADDVIFTYAWISDPANATTSFGQYSGISEITAPDPLTVHIRFARPQAGWYIPFAGTSWGVVYPKHVLDGGGQEALDAFSRRPIGTGAFVVDEFLPGDHVIYVANERYREPQKPFFSRVYLKGGGDAASAARSVLQTGDFDIAWNLQVEPRVLSGLAGGGKGTVVVAPGANLERLQLNFSDPHTEVDGQRAEVNTPHPFFTDKRVRQAFSLAINKQQIADELFLEGESPASNFLVGIPAYDSPNTTWTYDPKRAHALLDDAGWGWGEGHRIKDGVELKVTYAAPVNQVRQKTQAIIKQNWEEIGVRVEILQVDPGVFFDQSPGNDQNMSHFYYDVEMWSSGSDIPFPLAYMEGWYGGAGNIPQKDNSWTGLNQQRYVNPKYDTLWQEAGRETDPARLVELFIAMNDLVVEDVAGIPLIQRAAQVYGIANRLNGQNIVPNAFEQLYWNIANWNLAEGLDGIASARVGISSPDPQWSGRSPTTTPRRRNCASPL
jgi:peptide/nickel transport system substrate-binding protein